jgi:glyoxylase-like metal-dependent hydrolase (beta-lactamase superfamily II)
VDPGDASFQILKMLETARVTVPDLKIESIFHTHAHLDHFGATRPVVESLSRLQGARPQVILHADDADLWKNLQTQGQMFGRTYDPPTEVDVWVEDGEVLEVGSLKFECLHTPGHSPGGLCFYLKDQEVYTGDTLFQGSVGRTDLWGGDHRTLIRSIQSRLMVLEEDLPAHPGHGPSTLIGIEKRENPFL